MGGFRRKTGYNGDHFVVYFATEDTSEVLERIGKLTDACSELAVRLEVPPLQPYFGISHWFKGQSVELAFGEANLARHTVKERKDVNYAFYSITDTARILEEKWMENHFQEAIQEKKFEIWYQPKYSPQTGKMVGAEALVRWRREDGSLVSPAAFIPLFERNGLIRTLDEYVFWNVCIQQKKWRDAGKQCMPVSVNLSRASLYFSDIVERYRGIIDEVGIDSQLVPIEITESVAVDNKDMCRLAEKFYEKGFLIYMDDFGTGYASLVSLNELRFDTLKLDKSLIDYIGSHRGNQLLKHTIALAKDLGFHVVAEGVEREEQVRFLAELNCDCIQGFFYSRPLPVGQFEELWRNENL